MDAAVAKALALPARGAAYSAVTIGCKTSVQLVAVSDWKLGEATLPAKTIVSAKTVFAGATLNGVPIGGLLGSDVLSRFGTVTLDFAGQRLILRGNAPRGGRTIPVKVERYNDGKVLVIVGATIGDKTAAYTIDTGSPTAVIESRAATQLGLRAVGKGLTVQGATACSATATPVRIDNWTASGVKLPATVGLSSRDSFIPKAVGVVGLIGANVLSTFGAVTIDFADSRMVLGGTTG